MLYISTPSINLLADQVTVLTWWCSQKSQCAFYMLVLVTVWCARGNAFRFGRGWRLCVLTSESMEKLHTSGKLIIHLTAWRQRGKDPPSTNTPRKSRHGSTVAWRITQRTQSEAVCQKFGDTFPALHAQQITCVFTGAFLVGKLQLALNSWSLDHTQLQAHQSGLAGRRSFRELQVVFSYHYKHTFNIFWPKSQLHRSLLWVTDSIGGVYCDWLTV